MKEPNGIVSPSLTIACPNIEDNSICSSVVNATIRLVLRDLALAADEDFSGRQMV